MNTIKQNDYSQKQLSFTAICETVKIKLESCLGLWVLAWGVWNTVQCHISTVQVI